MKKARGASRGVVVPGVGRGMAATREGTQVCAARRGEGGEGLGRGRHGRNAAFLRHARRHSPHRTAPRTSQSRWNAPPLRAPQCRPWEPCISVALWPRGTLWLTLWSCGACCGSNGAALCHTPGMWGVWQAGQGGARLECGPQQHPYTAFRDAQQLRRYLVVLVWVARRQPIAAPRVGQRAACRPVVLQATVGFV
ncbi:hypothetical protein E2C01_047947 [Portunus trituberculatus]|uniref:Uncharacterized protein n=1 Tax=Portunus trituberculatus TaxID=210409 RepID=A0A5B7G1V3_PORTR|nr:hypothetical protein [Portunus trituberculatus]